MNDPQQIANSLPRYKCHKEVRAAKIAGIEGTKLILTTCQTLPMEDAWFAKHAPKVGGYLVVYDNDGETYLSFSPQKPFEQGYTEIKPQTKRG